jgi:hypothetical protein
MPENNSLQPEDVTLWLKKVRKKLPQFRYFLVGEYGEKHGRPHYHLIMFNVQANFETEKIIKETWGHGFIQIKPADHKNIQYTARYVIKKLTKPDQFPEGVHPEYARQSRMPGLGHGAAIKLVESYMKKGLLPADSTDNQQKIRLCTDGNFRYNKRMYPLSSYISEKILDELDKRYPDAETTDIRKAIRSDAKIRQQWKDKSPEELDHEQTQANKKSQAKYLSEKKRNQANSPF